MKTKIAEREINLDGVFAAILLTSSALSMLIWLVSVLISRLGSWFWPLMILLLTMLASCFLLLVITNWLEQRRLRQQQQLRRQLGQQPQAQSDQPASRSPDQTTSQTNQTNPMVWAEERDNRFYRG